MSFPPSYSSAASVSRSRAAPDAQSLADAMLRASLSGTGGTTTSSSSTTPSQIIHTPKTITHDRDADPLSTASSATSQTRERLRQVELERDELRRAMKEDQARAANERAVAERLRREGGVPGLSAAEAKTRLHAFEQETKAAMSKAPLRSSKGLFREACSTDLLFLIDATSSMRPYIESAKEQVKSIMADIMATFLGEAEVRIAVVAYRDHEISPNIEFIDFTTSADDVHLFLGKLKAKTAKEGYDYPEDVLGGISQAINASWKHQNRCLIHIGDAPPHGNIFKEGNSKDNYPNPGSEPHGLTYQPLLKQLIGLGVNYVLLRITKWTDCMAFLFMQKYAEYSTGCKLHNSNKYYAASTIASSSKKSGRSSAKGGLLFEELQLGISYSQLQHLVVKSVTSSASRTAVVMSESLSRTGSKGGVAGALPSLAAIEEDEDQTGQATLEEVPPEWETPDWLNETLVVEGFSPDVVIHGADTLKDMMADDRNIKLSIMDITVCKRSQPFAQGALRTASYARASVSTNPYVVKAFKRGGKQLVHLAEDMRCQALCKAFALEFNALTGPEHSIDFVVTTCFQGKSATRTNTGCLSLEPYIDGPYVKYNNNSSYVNEDIPDDPVNQAAQAFSHFTFERSWGDLLVCDLQGVGRVLTDPGIHTRDPERFKLTDTNLGSDGFKFFFATHECNDICRKLELQSNRQMMMSGDFQFREWWPTIDNTVCCSNKLCGKIVRVACAQKSDEFPGRHWCDICWPQLESSKVKWLCVEPGPDHEFEVSGFFYESQGRPMPRKCSAHRETEEATNRTAVVGGSFWNRFKGANKKKSISGKAW